MAGPVAASRSMQMLVTRFERLSRRISLAGLMSGHKAVEAIEAGRVEVDGRTASANFKVFSEASVTVDGRYVPPPRPRPRLWAFVKPRKVLCTDTEQEGVDTLRGLLKAHHDRELRLNGSAQSVGLIEEDMSRKHFVVVSGLSFAADGLVLLTNDGIFADRLMSEESKILTAFDVKISGDPPVDLLHSWRRKAKARGIDYGQVFTSISKRTGATCIMRLRYVETSQRPVEMLMEEAKLRVLAVRRFAFGPYLVTQYPKRRAMEIPVHKSLMHLCPEADMRQALVPHSGAALGEDGRLRAVGLDDSVIVDTARPGDDTGGGSLHDDVR